MSVNWGLGQQGGGSFIDSWNRGMATAGALETQQRQRAAAEQAQQAQAQARGMLAQGRDLDAARLLAGSGQAEEANALRAIFQQQTERATTANGAMANIVGVVGRLPYEQRAAAIRQAAPFLMQMGIEPQQIADFDPTDENVSALSRMFYTAEMEQDDNREAFEANTGRQTADVAKWNALHPQVDGTQLEFDENGQNPRVIYRRERFNSAPVENDAYVEPGVWPSQAPANGLPVQGQAQPQGQGSAFNSGRLPVGGMPQQFAQPQQPQQFAEQAPQEAPQLAEGELYVPGGENWGRPEGQAQAPQGEVTVGNLTVPAEWIPQDRPTEQPQDQAAPQEQRAERQQVALPYGRAGFGIGNSQQIQNTLYDEYRQLGWTHEGALTMVAQVGRENGFNPQTIFGTHQDANRSAGTNAGMVSWNRGRRSSFMQAMAEQGFVQNGRLVVSEESLRAQARYSDQEMQERYSASARAVRDPNLGYGEIEPTLSTNYYGWDRSGSAVLGAAGARQHRERMAGYYQTAARGFGNDGGSEYQQASASTGAGQDPASQSGMGYRRVTQGRQRPARPNEGGWRTLSPQEVRSRGYAQGTVVQVGPNDEERVRQHPSRSRGTANGGGTRNVPRSEVRRVEGIYRPYLALEQAVSGFRDDFAGNTIFGDLENQAQRLLGTGTEGQSDWWEGMRTLDNEVRHGLFGAALTAHEKAEWARTTVTPRMAPDQIRQNLRRRFGIAQGAIRRTQQTLLRSDYRRDQVMAMFDDRMFGSDGGNGGNGGSNEGRNVRGPDGRRYRVTNGRLVPIQ